MASCLSICNFRPATKIDQVIRPGAPTAAAICSVKNHRMFAPGRNSALVPFFDIDRLLFHLDLLNQDSHLVDKEDGNPR